MKSVPFPAMGPRAERLPLSDGRPSELMFQLNVAEEALGRAAKHTTGALNEAITVIQTTVHDVFESLGEHP